MVHAIEREIGEHLGQRARVTVEHQVGRTGDADRDPGLLELGLQARHHLVDIPAQLEAAPRLAHLVHRDLLEAVDQVGGAVGVVHDQARAFGSRLQVAGDVRLLDIALGHRCVDLLGRLHQHRGAGERDADRGVDFVGHAGHQAAQRGQPLGLQQRLLRQPQLVEGAGSGQRGLARLVLGLADALDIRFDLALDGIETTNDFAQFVVAVVGQLFHFVAVAGGQVHQAVAQALERIEHDAQRQGQRRHQDQVQQQHLDHLAPHLGRQRGLDLGAAEIDHHPAHDHRLEGSAGAAGITVGQVGHHRGAADGGVGFDRHQGAVLAPQPAGEQPDRGVVHADRDQLGRHHFGGHDVVDLGLVQVPQRRRQARLQPRQHALAQPLAARLEFLRQAVLGIGAGNTEHEGDDHHEQQRQAALNAKHRTLPPSRWI